MTRKVLVADDNVDAITILRSALEARGFAVVTASTGAEALAAVETDPPDVILLDVMMPEMSGIEALQRLKDSPKTAKIPVILVTAKTHDDDVLSGYQFGADYYITKPFTSKQLMYGINLVLGLGDAGG